MSGTGPGSPPDPSRPDSVSRAQLRDATYVGLRWMAVARGAAEVVAFGSLVALAHLVPPAEFGRATIALIVPMLASIMTFEACGSALVQRDSIEPAHLRAAFMLALATGISLAGVTYVAAPLISDPLFGDRTTSLVQLASAGFLIFAFAAVPLARLQRALDFKRISLAEVAGVLATAGGSLALAIAGLDAHAIVLGTLAGGAVTTAVLVASAPPPAPALEPKAMREIAGFGLPAALQGLSWIAFRNVDYVIIGARLGAAQVGYYFRAFQFGVEYQGKISTIIMNIAFPVLSRTEDLEHMRGVHGRIVRTQAVLIYPFLASLIALAPVLVPWLLGDRWSPAAAPAQILAVAGMAFVLMVTTGQVVLAAGHPRPLFAFNLGSLVVYATTILLAAPQGLIAVSIAATVVYLVMLLGTYVLLLGRLVGVPLRSLWDHAAPALGASLVMLAVEVPLADLLDGAGAPAPVVIVGAAAAGLAGYAATLRLRFPAAWSDCAVLLARLLGRDGSSPGGGGPRVTDPPATEGAAG